MCGTGARAKEVAGMKASTDREAARGGEQGSDMWGDGGGGVKR